MKNTNSINAKLHSETAAKESAAYMSAKTIAAETLGCKVNACDTQAMLELFIKEGYRAVDFSQPADVYLINTCSVTNIGDKKSRQMIRRAKKQNPAAIVVAAGCYAQTNPAEASATGADILIGNTERANAVYYVKEFEREKTARKTVSQITDERIFEELQIENLNGHTRGYVKIQDGCDNFCSYCIVPYARGRARSRKIQDCVSQCKRLAENGFTEIVLSGINIASYGKDLENETLTGLIAAIHDIPGIKRIRFSSADPRLMTNSFIGFLKTLPKICDFFHLSLQSGCDKTLLRMNRKYDTALYASTAESIRSFYPDAAITTDIIVGFPGETEKDFRDSYDFCGKMRFAKIHVFPFSAKKGTAACSMEGQVPYAEKKKREEAMLILAQNLRGGFLDENAGKIKSVLFEKEENGFLSGYTENYISVKTENCAAKVNTVKNVLLKRHMIS
ncbi:MAG: tRNA (N(6)-L-threonylcarbamoyladenosine(37)-C(2))-methylthiotransferase MtaB [Clostridiales bacterium]|nr:tRNA (N(6)-L-threonylcarbamoyladenosine(37)-C(2))-methylthiotransferase MtaB [Clostridiales bacterium]